MFNINHLTDVLRTSMEHIVYVYMSALVFLKPLNRVYCELGNDFRRVSIYLARL